MNKPLALTAVVTAALLAAYLLGAQRLFFAPGSTTAPLDPGSTEVGAEPVRSPVELGADPVDRTPLAPAVAPPTEREAEAAPAMVVAVSGRIELVNLQGSPGLSDLQREDLDGRFRMSLRSGSTGYGVDVEIIDGRFEATLERLEDGRLGRGHGRSPIPADVQQGAVQLSEPDLPALGAFRFAPAKGVDTRGRWSLDSFGITDVVMRLEPCPGMVLHVLDDASGAPLTQVEVLGSASHSLVVSAHPHFARPETYATGASSPVSLKAPPRHRFRDEAFVVARAPGYAWALAIVKPKDGGEATVRLRPGGGLDIRVRGDLPEGAVISVQDLAPRPPSGGLLRGPVPESRSLELKDLPAGPVVIAVGPERRRSIQPPLAQLEAEVIQGTVVTVDLDVGTLATLPPVALTGTLRLPSYCDPETTALTFRRNGNTLKASEGEASMWVAELAAIEGQERAYAFELPELAPGEWLCELEVRGGDSASGWFFEFELPPGGLSGLEVAPPAEVRVQVRVVHKLTGEPLPEASVSLHRARPERWRSRSSRLRTLRPSDESPTSMETLVIPGTFDVSAKAKGFGRVRETLTLDGTRDVTLEIAPVITARLRYFEDETPVRGVFLHGLTLTGPDGAEVEMLDRTGHGDFEYSFAVTAPGHYRLSFPEIEGYERPEPVEFHMVPGEMTELDVKLTAVER